MFNYIAIDFALGTRMSDRTYPYTAWLLTRNLQLLQVELVDQGFAGSAYDRTESGRNYPVDRLFASKASAIACAETKLDELADELARRQTSLHQRQAELQRHKDVL